MIKTPGPALMKFPVVFAEPPLQVATTDCPAVTAAPMLIVPLVPLLIVKLRSVLGVLVFVRFCSAFEAVSDVVTYASVPPLNTRLLAALLDSPMLLAAPPFARVLIASVPFVSVVVP